MDKTNILRVAVCEDYPSDAALMEKTIEECGIPSEVRVFKSAEAFLEVYRGEAFDVIFMDIYLGLGAMKGIEAAKSIRETDPNVVIAFVTTSLDHTLESYRLSAFKYLEKPVTKDAVRETLEYALLKRKRAPAVTLKTSGGKEENIPLDSILFLESRGHTVEVHTSSGLIVTNQTTNLEEIGKMLPTPQFLRCHRSYLVNLDHVMKVDRELHVFVMKSGGYAHIRRGYLPKYERELDGWFLYKAGRDDI